MVTSGDGNTTHHRACRQRRWRLGLHQTRLQGPVATGCEIGDSRANECTGEWKKALECTHKQVRGRITLNRSADRRSSALFGYYDCETISFAKQT